MCGYCIESGFVFDFWQHGHFTLPAPYRADTGESTIDYAIACYALFEVPNPAQLSGPWLEAAQTETPYWLLRQLEQALLALPLAYGDASAKANTAADLETSVETNAKPLAETRAETNKETTRNNLELAVNPNSWPTLSALWQYWQQPQAEQNLVLPAAIDHKLLNEARACLYYVLQPFENVQDSINNYQPEQDVFTENEEASNCFYACFAEAWLAFCLLRRFVPFDPLLIRWSAVMPRHMPSFGGEDLVIIRQAFWHCLSLYGAPYFIEHGPYQRAELLAYAAKRFTEAKNAATINTRENIPLDDLVLLSEPAATLDLTAFNQLLNRYWQGGNHTGFSIAQAAEIIAEQLTPP